MIISLGILAILWRSLCVLLLVLVLVELRWAQRHDGKTLASLRGVFAGVLFVMLLPVLAAIDRQTDISPGFDWRALLDHWVWVAHATLATCLVRFWLTLHCWSREKRKEKNG